MSANDAIGRRDEVCAAFLEGWRKSQFFGGTMSDREAWRSSDAYSRLAYGVHPPCVKCGCQVINPDHPLSACQKCGNVKLTPTTQRRERPAEPDEPYRLNQVLARALHRLGDGSDAFRDERDYPDD